MDQELGCTVHEIKVIAGLIKVGCAVGIPIETQPLDRVQNGVDVLGVFFFGVGVVKTHVANTTVVAGQAKVQANALGVAYVQVTIGLGWKTCSNFGRIGIAVGMVRGIARCAGPFALSIGALGQIRFNDLTQKVTDLRGILGGAF